MIDDTDVKIERLSKRLDKVAERTETLDKAIAVAIQHADGINAELGRVAGRVNSTGFEYITKEFCQERHGAVQRGMISLEAMLIRTMRLYWVALAVLGTAALANLAVTIIALKGGKP